MLTLPCFEGGGDNYLKSNFKEGRVIKILNFTVKINGSGRGVAYAKSSNPAIPPPKRIWNEH